jgi:hypothetical protein
MEERDYAMCEATLCVGVPPVYVIGEGRIRNTSGPIEADDEDPRRQPLRS